MSLLDDLHAKLARIGIRQTRGDADALLHGATRFIPGPTLTAAEMLALPDAELFAVFAAADRLEWVAANAREAAPPAPDERELSQWLAEHPQHWQRLTLLINGYREQVQHGFEQMHAAHLDTADGQIALAKRDQDMRRLGIPLLKTAADWMAVREGTQKEGTYDPN